MAEHLQCELSRAQAQIADMQATLHERDALVARLEAQLAEERQRNSAAAAPESGKTAKAAQHLASLAELVPEAEGTAAPIGNNELEPPAVELFRQYDIPISTKGLRVLVSNQEWAAKCAHSNDRCV